MALITIALGIIQGLTEFIPVSSSGHLILFSWLFEGKSLPLSTNIALHMGTTMAVLIYFFKDWQIITLESFKLLKNPKAILTAKSNPSINLLLLLIIGSIPAGVVGILWKDEIEEQLHKPLIVIFPLAIVGFVLWYMDIKSKESKNISQMSYVQALLIGCAQMCALIPGVSRSGATILAARGFQFTRTEAARFSFLLGTPAMLAAALVNYKEFLQNMYDPNLYIGIAASFLSGIIAIKWLLRFIVRFGFFSFAIYRLLLALFIGWIHYQ